jgi:hypothetical protein
MNIANLVTTKYGPELWCRSNVAPHTCQVHHMIGDLLMGGVIRATTWGSQNSPQQATKPFRMGTRWPWMPWLSVDL